VIGKEEGKREVEYYKFVSGGSSCVTFVHVELYILSSYYKVLLAIMPNI
jgi:hypothetical protein